MLCLKVTVPRLKRAVSKNPGRCWRQQLHTFKERSILQYTTTSNQFTQTSEVSPSQRWANGENRLCFRGEIKSLLGLVEVDPMHPVAIVEQSRGTTRHIYKQTVEPPIQSH